jgi:hypothetical protein
VDVTDDQTAQPAATAGLADLLASLKLSDKFDDANAWCARGPKWPFRFCSP